MKMELQYNYYDDTIRIAIPPRGQSRNGTRVSRPPGVAQPGSTQSDRYENVAVSKRRGGDARKTEDEKKKSSINLASNAAYYKAVPTVPILGMYPSQVQRGRKTKYENVHLHS